MSRRGFTLTELLFASVIGVGIILALANVDVARIRIGQKAQGVSEIQLEPGLAVTHLTRSILRADRANLISASNLQLRLPPESGTGLDDPANYTWVQYRLDGTQVVYYKDASVCTRGSTFNEVDGLTLQYRDEALAPPGGGEPLGGPDNNVLEILITSIQDPRTGQQVTFRGQGTLRASGYTDLANGLLPAGVGEPPASCS